MNWFSGFLQSLHTISCKEKLGTSDGNAFLLCFSPLSPARPRPSSDWSDSSQSHTGSAGHNPVAPSLTPCMVSRQMGGASPSEAPRAPAKSVPHCWVPCTISWGNTMSGHLQSSSRSTADTLRRADNSLILLFQGSIENKAPWFCYFKDQLRIKLLFYILDIRVAGLPNVSWGASKPMIQQLHPSKLQWDELYEISFALQMQIW